MSLYGNAALGHAQINKNDVTLSQATVSYTRQRQRQHATVEFCVTFIKKKTKTTIYQRLRH